MNNLMLPLPGLSPVSGKTVVVKFDGGLLSSDGGILVLRAEALSRQPVAWEALKGALRDRKIRIEEPHRTGTIPIASASPALTIRPVIMISSARPGPTRRGRNHVPPQSG